MTLRIATWNVNSVRQRLEHLARFSDEMKPDLLCLQETKVQDEDFPQDDLRRMGYKEVLFHGQKSYNGVAILSRRAIVREERIVWCSKDDRRHLAVHLEGGLELHNFYVPAGGDKPDPEVNDKFAHKIRFLKQMASWARRGKLKERKAVLVGDMNVAPLEHDVWNHKKLRRSVGHTDLECELMQKFWKAGGLVDVPRQFHPSPEPLYSWWGYRFAQAFAKNYGWRLDHVLVTPPLASAVQHLEVVKDTRSWTKPSDHVPVVLDLA